MSCATPISDEQLVAYWANDLEAGEAAGVEDHVFACDSCFASATRIQRIVQVFRGALPTVIDAANVAALRARGMAIVETSFEPGKRAAARFAPNVDLMIHHLAGLDLASAERVDVIVRSESGRVINEERCAPFDRQRGEVLVACQRHFAAWPHDIAFDVYVHRASTSVEVSTFFIPHEFLQ